jgi:YbbR domain-containing protein
VQFWTTIAGFIRQRISRIQIVRFLISLVLATLLWGWVTQIQDPMQERDFASVPIVATGLDDSLTLVTTLQDASLTLTGPRSDIQGVRLADISLSIDLSGIDEPGTQRVRVLANLPGGVDVERISPSELQIQVEEVVTQNFQVTPEYALPDDDPRQIVNVTPSMTQVTVSGPSSVMQRVANVVLPITVAQQTTTFEASFTPRAVDAQGQAIADVTILPQQIDATVELDTRGKEISVIPIVTGDPGEGFSVQQKSVVPEVVIVDGPDDVLENLLFVNTQPVDITGATGSVSQKVGIAGLPEGVTILQPPDGAVEIRVAIEDTTNTSQVIPSVPIEVTGLAPGLNAEVVPQTMSMTIDASQAVLQSLVVSDIAVSVSAEGLGPGTYQLELEIDLQDGVNLVSADQQVVRVVISSDAASPESSPTSSG